MKPCSGLRCPTAMAALVALAACGESPTSLESRICALAPEVKLALPCSNEPRRIADDPWFRSLAAGGSHVCGITEAGLTYCWGSNGAGTW